MMKTSRMFMLLAGLCAFPATSSAAITFPTQFSESAFGEAWSDYFIKSHHSDSQSSDDILSPGSVAISGGKYGNSYKARARSELGALKASAFTTTDEIPFGAASGDSAAGTAIFTDYLSFAGGSSEGEGLFLGHLTGAVRGIALPPGATRNGGGAYTFDAELARIDYQGNVFDEQFVLLDSGGTDSAASVAVDRAYQRSFHFIAGEQYRLKLSLKASAYSGGFSDFSNGAAFALSLPLGFTGATAMGSCAYCVNAVPEPANYAMLMAGLGAIALRATRQRGRATWLSAGSASDASRRGPASDRSC